MVRTLDHRRSGKGNLKQLTPHLKPSDVALISVLGACPAHGVLLLEDLHDRLFFAEASPPAIGQLCSANDTRLACMHCALRP